MNEQFVPRSPTSRCRAPPAWPWPRGPSSPARPAVAAPAAEGHVGHAGEGQPKLVT